MNRRLAALLFLGWWLAACSEGGLSTSGGLTVTSQPSGAQVLINGELRGRTPLTVRELAPGDYEVVWRKEGYQDAQAITKVGPRQIIPVSNTLLAERPPVTHRLAFFSNRDGAFDIWTTDEFGGDAVRWSSLRLPRSPTLSIVSPDGANFAVNFDTGTGTTTHMLPAPRPRGENSEPEARLLGGDIFRVLLWSPDSRKLLLKNLISQTIWVAALSGTVTPVFIPDAPRGVLTAVFAPDPNYIAFVDYERTYLIGLDGTRRQPLIENGQEGNSFLRFSRDGRRLAHIRVQKLNPYNAGELWLMNANGSAPRRLSLVGAQDFDPVWSHDGRKILFVHRENVDSALADTDPALLVSNLWYFDLDSQLLKPLTGFKGKRVRMPSISRDDQRVTFVSNQSGTDAIWMVDLHGAEPYMLTNDKATNSYPMWLW